MKITNLVIGKSPPDFVKSGVDVYVKRISRYTRFEHMELPGLKKSTNLSLKTYKEKEGELLQKHITAQDYLVLLDAGGKRMDSPGFSKFIQQCALENRKNVVFLTGGAYGFSPAIYARSNFKLSLSSMTFSHQVIRLAFLEQLSRAFTILNNEPYHH